MIKPNLITAPAQDPLTLEDVKAHARVFYADDDAYINGLIKAATSYTDGYRGILNRCIVPQVWQTSHRGFCRKMETLFTDTTAVVVKYYDVDGDLQTIENTDDAAYRVYPDYIAFVPGFSFPDVQCRDDAVLIESTHGYDNVPESLLLAIKIMITHWYRNREAITFGVPVKVPFSIKALLAPHMWAKD